jgi:putative membrane protein
VVPNDVAFQNLLPAFMGLFAVPSLIVNAIQGGRVPVQQSVKTLDATADHVARGVFAGTLGGMFAAFFPVVTGGIGGLLAGHATAQRDSRVFIIAQGTNKVVYLVGAYWLFFMPNVHLVRGGLASMVSTIYTAYSPTEYYTVVGAIALCGALAFALTHVLTLGVSKVVPKISLRVLAVLTLVLLLGVVVGFTGISGLVVTAVATFIGLIPLLAPTRRMYGLGVLLVPITLNMAGVGSIVAKWLGLL